MPKLVVPDNWMSSLLQTAHLCYRFWFHSVNKRIGQTLRWILALAVGAVTYALAFLVGVAVSMKLLPDSDSVRQGSAQAAGSAIFILVGAAIAPSPRKELVSQYLALLVVVVSGASAWRLHMAERAVPFLMGTIIGSSCIVVWYRLRTKTMSAPLAVRQERQGEAEGGSRSGLPSELHLSDAVILALASVGSYALAFAYEAGFGSLYHIPPSLISLNLTTAFVAAAAGASALVLSYQALSVLVNLVPRSFIPSGESETRRFARFLSLSFLPIAYFTITGLNLVIMIGFFALVWLLLSKASAASVVTAPTAVGVVLEKLNPRLFLILNLAAYLLLIAFILGRYRALSEPQFIFDQEGTHYIVLRIYGEDIIAAPYVAELSDHTNLIVGGGLRFFKVGDKDTPEFRTRSRQTRLSIPRGHLLGEDPWRDWAYPYE